MKYNRQLMMAILHDKVRIAKAVNAKAKHRAGMRNSTPAQQPSWF